MGTDAWQKVQDAFNRAGDKISNQTKALIEKYKPKVKDALERVQKVIIEEGKRIVIEIIGDIVKVTVGDLEDEVSVYKRNVFADLWDKVKSAANNTADKVKGIAKNVLDQYKPQILAALENVNKVVIQGAKEF